MWSNLLKHAAGVQDGWDDDEEGDDDESVEAQQQIGDEDESHHGAGQDYDSDAQQQEQYEEDDEEHYSSQQASEEEDEAADQYYEDEHQQQQVRPPSLLATMTPGGGGRFMGRLSAFIEQVTHTDDNEEEEAESGEDDYSEDEQQQAVNASSLDYLNQSHYYESNTQQAAATPRRTAPSEFFTPAQQPLLDENVSFETDDDGWNEHDDLSVDQDESAMTQDGVLQAVNLAEPFANPTADASISMEHDENVWEQEDILDSVSVDSDPAAAELKASLDDDAVDAAVNMGSSAAGSQQQSYLHGMNYVPDNLSVAVPEVSAWAQDDEVDLNVSAVDMLASAAMAGAMQQRQQYNLESLQEGADVIDDDDNAWAQEDDLDLSAVGLSTSTSALQELEPLAPNNHVVSLQENAWADDDELELSAVNVASPNTSRDNDEQPALKGEDGLEESPVKVDWSASEGGSSPGSAQNNNRLEQDGTKDLELPAVEALSFDDVQTGPERAPDNAWEGEDELDVSEPFGNALTELHEDMHRLSYDEEEEITFEDQQPETDSDQNGYEQAGKALGRKMSDTEPSQAESSTLAGLEAGMQNLTLGHDLPSAFVGHHEMDHAEQVVIIDQIPFVPEHVLRAGPPSISVLADGASCSSSVNTPPNPFDTENETEFGPIVDHTPKRSGFQMNRLLSGESLGGAVGGNSAEDTINQGWDDDDDLDDLEEGTENAGEINPEYSLPMPPLPLSAEHLVDHTPAEIDDDASARRANTDMSIGVLAPDDASASAGEDDQMEAYGPVVDHTPLLPDGSEPTMQPSEMTNVGSTAAYAPSLEDVYGLDETECGNGSVGANAWDDEEGYGDDDGILPGANDTEEYECAADFTGAASTASSEPLPTMTSSVKFRIDGLEEIHIVDHTPRDIHDPIDEPANDPSLFALATARDLSRDSGDGDDEEIYDDENDFDYGPVVDQTPPTPGGAACSALSTANSMAVLGEASEFIDDDAMDSTVGGTEGWEQVELELDEDQTLLVDHTPSEMGSPAFRATNSSIIVLADATSAKDDDSVADHDSAGDVGVGFGPIVDQTPQTPVYSPFGFREDSIAAQAQDLDTIDESASENNKEEVNDDGDGGDTINEDGQSILRSFQDLLVDHIPSRRERYGDASTMVAADPSEVMSEVDDMVGMEDNFGPVVDQIPPTRPNASINLPSMAESATGSTVAFAPASIAADDLDAEDETRIEEEENFPNPQSGGDEENDMNENVLVGEDDNEQVVDILPAHDGAEVLDREDNREALSEITIGGALSLLLPLAEEEFGPVVDQLPQPRGSLSRSGLTSSSDASQLSPSECRSMIREDLASARSDNASPVGKSNVVIDHLPGRLRSKRASGSNSSIGESQLLEDEDEEEDNSKFGPIVDQLPTSTVPSCGGSTVDAMANVSEAASDDGVWDDDVDMDVSESGVSDGTALRTAMATRTAFRRQEENDRNVSVRFDTAANSSRAMDLNETEYYDILERTDATDGTQNLDSTLPRLLHGNGWFDGNVDMGGSLELTHPYLKSFAEADTPPSTPHRRYEDGERSPTLLLASFRCMTCESGSTMECPCIKKLLQANNEDGSLIGKVRTPDGVEIALNFSELLEREMMKRSFVEHESTELRKVLDAHKLNDSMRAAKQSELELEVASLQRSNAMMEQKLATLESKNATIENERNNFETKYNEARLSVSCKEVEHASAYSQNAALISEVESLKHLLNGAAGNSSTDADQSNFLKDELALKTKECANLTAEISELRIMAIEFQEQRLSHQHELAAVEAKMKQLSEEQQQNLSEAHAVILRGENALKENQDTSSKLVAELDKFRKENTDLNRTMESLNTNHANELRELYRSIDKKSAEVERLKNLGQESDRMRTALISDLSCQRSLAEETENMAAELLAVAKERDVLQASLADSKEVIAALQKLIDEQGLRKEELEGRRETELSHWKAEASRLAILMADQEAGFASERNCLSEELDEARRQLVDLVSVKTSLESSLDGALKRAAETDDMTAVLRCDNQALQSELSRALKENQELEENRKKTTSHLAALGRSLERKEKECQAIAKNASDCGARLVAKEHELSALLLRCQSLSSEVESLMDIRKKLQVQLSDSLAASDQKMADALSLHQEELICRDDKIDTLSNHLDEIKSQADQRERQFDQLVVRCQAAEDLATRAIEDAQTREGELTVRFEQTVRAHQEEQQLLADTLSQQSAAHQSLTVERNQLSDECKILSAQVFQLQELQQRLESESNIWASREQELNGKIAKLSSTVEGLSEKKERLGQQLVAGGCISQDYDILNDRYTKLQQECSILVEKSRLIEQRDEELALARNEVLVLTEENEEILVQFGLLKQQLDESEGRVDTLQLELQSICQSSGQYEGAVLIKSDSRNDNSVRQELDDALQKQAEMKERLSKVVSERDSLTRTVASLESSFHKQKSTLLSKLDAIAQEKDGLLRAGSDPTNESLEAEVSRLSEQLQSSLAKVQELDHMKAMAKEKELAFIKLQDDLRVANDALSMAQDQLDVSQATLAADAKVDACAIAVNDLENLESQLGASEIIAEYEKRMEALQHELTVKESTLYEKSELVSKLQESLTQLRDQLSLQGSHAFGHSINFNHLHQSLQLATVDEESSDKLRAELKAVTQELKATQEKLARKEDELTHVVAPKAYEGEPVGDVQSLHSHVISLAVALERSETKRAEAIAKLIDEREASAESLRRLSESVKRFYASVSYGDV
ncbi:hypothetical protein MPSEU_000013200 [Mayamaea pseudoterrestris]|nr:hypothetical protein MPSEU_000013200 [Mayamaea pseudoterrestris]